MPEDDHGWQPSRGGPLAPSTGSAPRSGAATLDVHRRPRIRDQGDVGCCVSIAITGAFELLLARGGRVPELSPMFHYYRARSDPSALVSLSILDGLQVAIREGICSQRLHDQPITATGARIPPSQAALADAKELAGARYNPATGGLRGSFEFFRLPDYDRRDPWLQTLSSGWPILLGFWQTPGYAAIHAGQTQHSPQISPRASIGHAVLVVGHRRGRGFRIVDAKGRGFADNGTWWLPDDLLETPLIQESWFLKPTSA